MIPAKNLHPLLLEPSYWRVRVLEFRLRSLDGSHLRGLFARSTWRSGPCDAILRTVRPASRLEIQEDGVREGTAEFVLQEPAGRPLADRVLDVVLLSQVAAEMDGICRVEVDHRTNQNTPQSQGTSVHHVHQWESDAAAIAQQLLVHRIVSPSADDPLL